jgi:phosphatidate cytidylyltransferase
MGFAAMPLFAVGSVWRPNFICQIRLAGRRQSLPWQARKFAAITHRMLVARFLLGTLFIAALFGLCWVDYQALRPGVVLLPLASLLSLLGAGELLAMFRQHGHRPQTLVDYSGVLITVLAAGMPVLVPSQFGGISVGSLGWLMIGLTTAFLLATVAELRRFEASRAATTNLALTTLTILYVGGLMGFLVQLRLLSGPPWGSNGRWGMLALVSLIATVKLSDIGQYTIGRLIGRHKLAPAVSPGKTWEGAAGGVVFAILAAWVVFHWGVRWIVGGSGVTTRPIAIVAFAVAVAAAGMVGDLAESMLKRDAGVKDSSTWMPGFGGVLDLLDSLLGAAPVAYLFWALHWVGP